MANARSRRANTVMMMAMDAGSVAAPMNEPRVRMATSAPTFHDRAVNTVNPVAKAYPHRYSRRWPYRSPILPAMGVPTAIAINGAV